MKYLKFILSCLFTLVLSTSLIAQTTENQSSSTFMMSNGKIFVVIAVVFTIILGLFIYLFSLDKKLTRMENKEKD